MMPASCSGHQQVLSTAAGRRPVPISRANGFRFLRLRGCWADSDRCGTLLNMPAHGAVGLSLADELLVAVLQVDEVGGGDLREIADFRGASEAEIED